MGRAHTEGAFGTRWRLNGLAKKSGAVRGIDANEKLREHFFHFYIAGCQTFDSTQVKNWSQEEAEHRQ